MRRLRAICGGMWVLGCRYSLLGACGVTTFAVVTLGITYPAGGCLLLAYSAWKRLRKWRASGWIYGTARLASFLDICKAGLLSHPDGLIIGRASFTARPTRREALRLLASPALDSRTVLRLVAAAFFNAGGNSLIRIHDGVHAAIFAATGAGKGIGVVIPILLSNTGSFVVIDPKGGENFKLTAAHRKKLGHEIIRLDPFQLCGEGTDSLNPLAGIDQYADDFSEQCMDVADSFIIVTGKEMQPHFPESAKIILAYIIAYVCVQEYDPEKRNLQTVRYILQSRHRFNTAVVAMQQHTSFGGLIAGMGHQLTWYIEKELASIQSTITRYTSWLDSPAMRAATNTSTFDPRKIKSCKCTVYLILPAHRLKTLAPLNRMWISTIMRALSQGVPDESRKVHFLLDEAGHLGGNMQVLEDAVTLMRGYGIRLIFFFQSIGQVSEVFGEHGQRFLDNIGTQIYFGVNAYESAEAISKRCGDASILVHTLNDSKSFSKPTGGYSRDQPKGSVSTSRSINYAELGRPLFRPDEILHLSEEVGLLFHRNMYVIPVKLLRYFKEPEFRRGRSAPYRGGVGIRVGLLAVFALFWSLVLLAVSIHLPAMVEQVRPKPWDESEFLPPVRVTPEPQESSVSQVPAPPQLVSPPSPVRPGKGNRKRQGVVRRGFGR